MGFGLFIFLIFWGGVTMGSHACQPDEPPPEPIKIIAPALHGGNDG
jgi:hypothetical protein